MGALSVTAGLPTEAGEKLMQAKPAKVDRWLEESLSPEVAGCLKLRVRNRTTAAHGFDEEFLGYEVATVPPAADLEKVQAALRNHEQACLPAPADRLIDELGRLRVLTTKRPDDMPNEVATLRIYAEKLREYPADIVLDVLRSQPSHSKFWPAWQELQERLEWRAKRRRARRDALAALLDRMEGDAA